MLRLCHWLALFAVVVPAPSWAGAWPREKGTAFVSVTQEFYRRDDDTITAYGSFHAEYGLTDKLTLGVKGGGKDTGGYRDLIAFFRYPLGDPAWTDRFGVEVGVGVRSNPLGGYETMLQPGLAWGRGFDTPMGSGWIQLETSLGLGLDSEGIWGKADLTVGLNLDEKSHVIVQLLSYDDGAQSYFKLAPSYVRRIREGIKIEIGLIQPLNTDERTGLKAGTWIEW